MLHYLIIALLGWGSGLLVNYLADVLPIRRRFCHPFCLACEEPQTLVNYFFWPRRCSVCGKRRSWRVWLVELTAVGAILWLWVSPPPDLNFFIGLLLLIYFGLVIIVDIEYRLILHPVSLAGAILGLITGIWLHGVGTTLLGGLAGFGSMLLLYFFGAFLVRLSARWRSQSFGALEGDDALGFGDVMLSGVLGLMLGWPGIFAGLILTILLGGITSLLYLIAMLITRRYHPAMALPYGPFLVASGVILLFFKGAMLSHL